MQQLNENLVFVERTGQIASPLSEALEGLRATPRRFPPALLYDRAGSALFEKICDADEYYLARAETEILSSHASEIGRALGRRPAVVEFGSGSGVKTKMLLDAIPSLEAYIAIDIAKDQLLSSTRAIAASKPLSNVIAIHGDYNEPLSLPAELLSNAESYVALFFGSTIGNLDPQERSRFFKNTAGALGSKSKLLIGFDLIKPVDRLESAYNDSHGYTARFNLNALIRLNRELLADFVPEFFQHLAFFNRGKSRIEMHLRSVIDQEVHIYPSGARLPEKEETFHFGQGETIHTESSYKFTPDSFGVIAEEAGLRPITQWTDSKGQFALALLEISENAACLRA